MNSTEMPSFDDVVAKISQEESRRLLMNSQQSEATENKAFKAQSTNPRGAAKTRGTPATDWCDHCKRAGHNRDGCWVLHPHLRPVRSKGERGGARKGEKEQRFGGLSKGAEPNSNEVQGCGSVQSTQPDKGHDLSGSSVVPTAQLA